MKKILILCLAVAASLLSACSDSDDGGGSTYSKKVVVDGSGIVGNLQDVSTVGVCTYHNTVLAQSDLTGNSFSLTLPAAIPADELTLLSSGMPSELTLSDQYTRAAWMYFEGYNSNREYVDSFTLLKVIPGFESSAECFHIYVDRDCLLSGVCSNNRGSTLIEYTYRVSLKTGWNTVCAVVKSTQPERVQIEVTEHAPGGMQWYFGQSLFGLKELM